MTTPQQIREICLSLSTQMKSGAQLSDIQILFLAKVLAAIGRGEDPAVVFGQKRSKGQAIFHEDVERKKQLVLFNVVSEMMIAKQSGTQITVAEAIRRSVDLANQIMGYRVNDPVIDETKIRRWWDSRSKRRNQLIDI
jgi:hypothetical protein